MGGQKDAPTSTAKDSPRMTDEPRTPLTLPSYGQGTLPDLATSLLGSLGVPGEANPLGLADTERACLLIVDGLGWELLRDHQAAAPFLAELSDSGRPLTAGFPATTVTSLSSLATGRPPGAHGMLGYQVAVPGTGRLLNGLRWDDRVDPLSWQPGSTIYERAADAGVPPSHSAKTLPAVRRAQTCPAPASPATSRSCNSTGSADSTAARHTPLDSSHHAAHKSHACRR